MHIQADRATDPSRQSPPLTSTTRLTVRENQRDNDTDRYELDSSIQASRRGGRTKSPGSKPIDQNGLPVCVLPRRPLSRISRTYGRHRTEPQASSFMPRKGAATDSTTRFAAFSEGTYKPLRASKSPDPSPA